MTESDWVPGRFGGALDFDERDDDLTTGTNDHLEGNSMTDNSMDKVQLSSS